MKSAPFYLLALAVSACLVSGCSNTPLSQPGNNFSSGNSVTGNWLFTPNYVPGQTLSAGTFYGSLSSSGASTTGTMHLVSTCVPITQDLAFTGTENNSGAIALTSNSLSNNVVTISAGPFANNYGITSGPGAISVTGSGACASTLSSFPAIELQTVNGSFTATAGSSALSAQLTQAAANSDGYFPESGTVSVTNGACANTLSLAGLVSGPNLSGNLTSTSGPAATAVLTGQLLVTTKMNVTSVSNIAIINPVPNPPTYVATVGVTATRANCRSWARSSPSPAHRPAAGSSTLPAFR